MGTTTTNPPSPGMGNTERPTLPVFAPVKEWCRLSGIGRTTTYEALGRGDLIGRKVGARLLIDVAHGLAWVQRQPPAAINVQPRHRAKQAA